MFNPIKVLGTVVKIVTGPLSAVLGLVLPKGTATGTGSAGLIVAAIVHLLVAKGYVTSDSATNLATAIEYVVGGLGALVTVWGASRAHNTTTAN